jgi:hypothetical protein
MLLAAEERDGHADGLRPTGLKTVTVCGMAWFTHFE